MNGENEPRNEQPEFIKITLDLVGRAFPEGVGAEEYFPLLQLLWPFFSNRHLTVLADHWTKDPRGSFNDVLGLNAETCSQERVEEIRIKLEAVGFSEWLKRIEEIENEAILKAQAALKALDDEG